MPRNLIQSAGAYIGTMEKFEFNTPDRRASTELYIFSQDDVLLAILSPETGLLSAPYREELNQVAETPFSFTVDADMEQSEYVREENQVVFRDKDGDLQLFAIKELDQVDNIDGPEITATCEPSFMELKEHIVVDRRMVDDTAQTALDAALEGTRWTGSVEVSLGKFTQNFYYMTSADAIWKILEVWGGEFKAVVEYDNKNNVNKRVIKILARRGADKGHRWEIGHNIQEIQRTVLSYPITAMYGRGASLQTDNGGHTRYIDFADVEWKKSNGDPVDKPKGQKWVGDPDALQKYGRQYKGKLLHREAIFSNQDYKDPVKLLQAAYDAVQNAKELDINYKLAVYLLEFIAGYEHEHVELGDTNQTVDRNFARPIEIEARVIALEYDLLDIEGTAQAELGQFLTMLNDDRIDRVIDEIEDNRPDWDNPIIDEGNYPDIKPDAPTNVEAVGGFQTIQVYWEYHDSIYIKHYELYASQTPDFVPDASNLIWRGNTSAFAHEVETDQVWYYYVRAVNYHGTPSDFSAKAEGATVRIITDDILFGAVTAEKIKDLAITAEKLAKNSVSREKLQNRIVNNQKLADLAVSAEKLLDGAVKSEKIANLAVGNAAIANAAITAAKINDLAVGNAAIQNASISRAKLQTAVIGTAQIEDAAITNAKIHNVSADKLTAGKIRGIDIYGSTIHSSDGYTQFVVSGGNAELTNNAGAMMSLSPDGIYTYNTRGELRFQADTSFVSTSAVGTINTNLYLGTYGETRAVAYNTLGTGKSTDAYTYNDIRAQVIHVTAVDTNWASGNATNLYLRPRAGAEVRVTASGTTNTYLDLRNRQTYTDAIISNSAYGTGGHLYIHPDDEVRITSQSSLTNYKNLRANDITSYGIIYGGTLQNDGSLTVRAGYNDLFLQAPAEVRATQPALPGQYIPVRADSFPTGSSEKIKKNITPYQGNALDLINNTTIYEYIRKSSGVKEVGFVIEKGLPEIVKFDAESVNGYSHRSLNTKAIQEMYQEFDGRLKTLEGKSA